MTFFKGHTDQILKQAIAYGTSEGVKKAWLKRPRAKPEWTKVKTAKDAALQAMHFFPKIKWGFWGADVDTINASMPKLFELLNEYPNVAAMTKIVGTPTSFSSQPGVGKGPHVGGIAMYSPTYRSILFNPHYYGTGKYEYFKAACKGAEASGFHPPGSGDVASVVTHEFGHMVSGYLHKQFNQKNLPDHTKQFLTQHYLKKGQGLGKPEETSQYSKSTQNGDYYEWFAESFVALHHAPKAKWSAHTKALAKALKGSGA